MKNLIAMAFIGSLLLAPVSSTAQNIEVKKQKAVYKLQLDGTPSQLLIKINKKNNTALSAEGSVLNIINHKEGIIRGSITYQSPIVDVAFADYSTSCAVLLKNKTIQIVDISNLKNKETFTIPTKGSKCVYMLQDKYLKVDNKDNFYAINLSTGKVEYDMPDDNHIEHKRTMAIMREIDLRMSEWSKIRPGESMANYRARVNDETRVKYALQLEHELITKMAGDKIGSGNPSIGNYITTGQALSINFDDMPAIYLNIPSEDLMELSTIEDLEFFNTIYGLTDDDEFEVIYTEARNKTTGKKYIYDNLDRKGIEFEEKHFVPMEVVKLANIEAARLEKIKQQELLKARNENILSDHTHISVSTNAEQDVDSLGNKILNYIVNYQYDVEESFSSKDDFRPGRYKTSESNAALQMIKIIEKSVNGEFAKYTSDCKKLIVSVTGSADALPIRGRLSYSGDYGDINNLTVYQNDTVSVMTINKTKGIVTNGELALLRGYGMSDYLKHELFGNLSLPVEYLYNIEVSDEKGGKFRRIKVSLKFVDTFKN